MYDENLMSLHEVSGHIGCIAPSRSFKYTTHRKSSNRLAHVYLMEVRHAVALLDLHSSQVRVHPFQPESMSSLYIRA